MITRRSLLSSLPLVFAGGLLPKFKKKDLKKVEITKLQIYSSPERIFHGRKVSSWYSLWVEFKDTAEGFSINPAFLKGTINSQPISVEVRISSVIGPPSGIDFDNSICGEISESSYEALKGLLAKEYKFVHYYRAEDLFDLTISQ